MTDLLRDTLLSLHYAFGGRGVKPNVECSKKSLKILCYALRGESVVYFCTQAFKKFKINVYTLCKFGTLVILFRLTKVHHVDGAMGSYSASQSNNCPEAQSVVPGWY